MARAIVKRVVTDGHNVCVTSRTGIQYLYKHTFKYPPAADNLVRRTKITGVISTRNWKKLS